MAKGNNQKLKILRLAKILQEETDEEHSLTMPQIVNKLEAYDISAERKSLYRDIEELELFGYDIIKERRGREFCYYIGSRDFELAELKLLVDSVQAAKFITSAKSEALIEKIESLTSKYEAKKLQRQVHVVGRIKSSNESVFYNVDDIYNAIEKNVKIRFRYFQWNVKKEREYRKNGEWYCISPWALSWDDENYYMVGFDDNAQMIKHYRVDKMVEISITEERREGKESFLHFDMASYAKKLFGMFAGEREIVRLRFDNALAGVVIDRFGKDITFFQVDKEHFEVSVNVAVSGQFLGWLFALGDGVRVVGPDNVVEQMKERLKLMTAIYDSDLK